MFAAVRPAVSAAAAAADAANPPPPPPPPPPPIVTGRKAVAPMLSSVRLKRCDSFRRSSPIAAAATV